jgi:hypothetical protein
MPLCIAHVELEDTVGVAVSSRELDLSGNELSGTLPNTLSRLSASIRCGSMSIYATARVTPTAVRVSCLLS